MEFLWKLKKKRISFQVFLVQLLRGCPRGLMVKAMDCGVVVSKFEFQSRYYVHFRTNTLGKGTNPLILPIYGLNSTTIKLRTYALLNYLKLNCFSTLKLYLHLTELLHINCLNSLKWKRFWPLNCVLMLNWIVLNRTDYLHKNGFGVK